MKWLRRWALAAVSLVVMSGFAAAQEFPSKPITFVVPFTPGAATDFLARMLGKELEEKFGKPVVVENRPGAGTNIGSNSVAKAAPDGHTLLMATSTPMAINASLYKNLPFDPTADFVPLALVAQSPFVLIAKSALPVNSVMDLIALAKEKPGQLSFGSAGPGSPHHLFAELLASMSGTKMNHVAYRGSVPALNDVVAGHIDFMMCDFAVRREHAAGRQGQAARRLDRGAHPGISGYSAAQRGGAAGLRRRGLVHGGDDRKVAAARGRPAAW